MLVLCFVMRDENRHADARTQHNKKNQLTLALLLERLPRRARLARDVAAKAERVERAQHVLGHDRVFLLARRDLVRLGRHELDVLFLVFDFVCLVCVVVLSVRLLMMSQAAECVGGRAERAREAAPRARRRCRCRAPVQHSTSMSTASAATRSSLGMYSLTSFWMVAVWCCVLCVFRGAVSSRARRHAAR